MKRLLAAFLLLPSLAFGQGGGIIQSGAIVPGNAPVWLKNGVLKDSGVKLAQLNGGGVVFGPPSTTLNDCVKWGNTQGTIIADAGVPCNGGISTLSVVSANGLAGTVANPSTTPAITLSTTVTGALKGDGTSISQAACADLSNGATGCSTAVGTSGATIPLLSTANTWGGQQNLNGGVNTTSASGYQITGITALNLLANQTSPILSPEIQNIPNPLSIYFPASLVVGYATSATAVSAATYNSMITANLTVVGTAPNHWGLEEHTINLLGTGTITGELNVQKNYVLTASTVTLTSGENFEAGLDNFGTISGIWHGYTSGMANASTGTITRVYVFDAGITNNNVTGNSVGIYVGYHCPAITGSGSAPGTDYCIFNEDPKGEIVNMGHYSARNDTNVPTLSGGCGTGGGALSATSNDDAGQMTIGAGGTITTCSIVFHLNYGNLSTAIVVASDGGTPPSYTYNGGGINISALRSGGVYQYWAIGAN